jgi:long-chain acyl-CoA synthetase
MATGGVVTYADLDRRSRQMAHLFRRLGLVPGDHVAFQLTNRPEFFDVLWGAHRAGLRYTAVSTRLRADETAFIVDDCGAKAFVTDREHAPAVEATAGATGERVNLVLGGGGVGAWESLEGALASCLDEPLPEERAGDDMLYSSGTTGTPKGIVREDPDPPPDQIDGVTALCQLVWGMGDGTRYLSPAPLYHAAPLRFCRSVHRLGGTVVLMEHFDPVEYLRLVGEHSITHTQLVPTMFIRMLKLVAEERAVFDGSSLQAAIHAAAPCPVEVKRQMIEWWGPVVWEYYAGSEGNGITLCSSEDWLAHPGSVGRPLGAAVHIVGAGGEELRSGEIGTVYFEGGGRFAYHGDPEKTASAHHPRGWSTIGDIGYVDEEGFLYLTDRHANMIISGGVNIYPQEAENLLALHPKVYDVAVFGVPNEEMGEEVKAVVQPVQWADAGPALEAELIRYCRDGLAHYKCPRSVDFERELPRQPTGKLYKRLLKDRYWDTSSAATAP